MNTLHPMVERPVAKVKGTISRNETILQSFDLIASRMIARIRQAGYRTIQTPDLDLVELHERKSGAAITTRILELADAFSQGPVCMRPELTVGVVRSLIESDGLNAGPARVMVRGSVYRLSEEPRNGLQQIEQIGVELLGDPSVEADAEVIAMADEALRTAGITRRTIRLGDVGLILEAVTSAGLPEETRRAVIETLADTAAAGQGIEHVENALEHWADWLGDQSRSKVSVASSKENHNQDLQRLFHQLVPHVVGRRTESEILSRLQQKWELSESLPESLKKASKLVHEIGGLAGVPSDIFNRLEASPAGSLIQKSLSRLKQLVQILNRRYGITEDRIRIDLSIARGIGFYSGLVFGIHDGNEAEPLKTPELSGGGRYDGLASVLGLKNGSDSGVGFAVGLDRVMSALHHVDSDETETRLIIISPEDNSDEAEAAASDLYTKLLKYSVGIRFATQADQMDTPTPGLIFISADGSLRGNTQDIDFIKSLETPIDNN